MKKFFAKNGVVLVFLVFAVMVIFNSLKQNYISSPEIGVFLESNIQNCSPGFLGGCQKLAEESLDRFGFKKVISSLELVNPNSNPSLGAYHNFLHFLGREKYKREPDLRKLFSECPSLLDACWHGIASGYIEQSHLAGISNGDAVRAINEICSSFQGENPLGMKYNCWHGLGHGTMLLTGNELPKSLELCDLLDQNDREHCYAGAFMENFPPLSAFGHPSKYLKAGEPLFPCTILDKKYLESCYLFLSHHLLLSYRGSPEEAPGVCVAMPTPYRSSCYEAVGLSLGSFKYLESDLNLCNSLPPAGGGPCAKGVVTALSNRFGLNNKLMLKMFDFCKTSNISLKKDCYLKAGEILTFWITDDRQRLEICNNNTETAEEKRWCLIQ